MKTKLLIFALACSLVATSSSMAQHARKLPAGAYLKSAKIQIVSGDLNRYPLAIAMLDSLQMYYGYHSEALFLLGQMEVDYIEHQSGPDTKRPYVEGMVAYFDTLDWACDKNNKEVDNKNKKDCKDYTARADSIKSLYWQKFYNDGVEQLRLVEEDKKELEGETDSTAIDFMKKSLAANVDSCILNMKLAILVNPNDHRPYIGAGQAYEGQQKYEEANKMLEDGLSRVQGDARLTLLLPIAYNYTSMGNYCKAADYMQQWVDSASTDDPNLVATMGNLAICYNNCGNFDKAFAVNQKVLSIDSNNTAALTNIVRYFNQMASDASKSATKYQTEDSAAPNAKEEVKKYSALRRRLFDSSLVYSKRAFILDSNNASVVEDYALAAALTDNYDQAAVAFGKLVELKPDDAKGWVSLGDVNLYLKKFPDAIKAYEKAVELQPDRKDIWQQLVDLYENEGMAKKKAAAQKKLQALK